MSQPGTPESEEQLVARAQLALSSCNWTIGECASQWTRKHAKGRTDADFGALIGLSGDQVFQRRRVWETFADVYENYPQLKWSHFYVVINWDDAAECLQWANEMDATVAQMKAWRRAQHGDDLTQPAHEEPPFSLAPEYLSAGMGVVQNPDDFPHDGRERASRGEGDSDEESLAVASAARESANSEYAPFGKGARGPAPGSENAPRHEATAEESIKKGAQALERVVAILTPNVLEEFPSLPIALQQRFLDAIENLQARTAGLS
jgi:hypothetical protein